MRKVLRIAGHWMVVESLGIGLLLGLILYLPVEVSEYWVRDFRPPRDSFEGVQQWARSSPATRGQLMSVIRGQIDVFRKGDFQKAFSYTAPSFRHQFSVAGFEKMIREGFAFLLVDHAKIEFGEAGDDGFRATILVRFTEPDGATVDCAYHLIREKEAWGIWGVMTAGIQPPGTGQKAP